MKTLSGHAWPLKASVDRPWKTSLMITGVGPLVPVWIVVDSSVWIDHFNGRPSAQVARLGEVLDDEEEPIVVGDIIMYEVLCGLRTDRARREVKELLESQLLVSMLGLELVYRAVGHYRALRARGVTIKAAGIFIATYCIANRTRLLTADADFLAIRGHLGLELA